MCTYIIQQHVVAEVVMHFLLTSLQFILQSIYVSSTSQSFPSYILWSPCEIWQQKVPSYDQSKAPKAWVCLNISWFWKVHLFLFNYFCLVLLHSTHNSTKRYSKFMVMESKSTGAQTTSMNLIMDTFSQRSYSFMEKNENLVFSVFLFYLINSLLGQ